MGITDKASATIVTATNTLTMTAPPSFEMLSAALADNFLYYLNKLDKLPGGSIVLRYIKSSYQDDPIRSLFEYALVIVAITYFLSSKRKENKSEFVKFSKAEIDELCNEWVPDPLVEPVTPKEVWDIEAIPEIKGANGAHITLGEESNILNLASFDFLNLNESEEIKEVAKATISDVGVGACGPPNFYGTQDVHVRLEEDLASYLDTESAIIYGQDFPTAGSVIAAFLKRGDLCVVDSGVNLAIQKALIVSRCDIEWYDHNSMEHLEQILSELKPILDKTKPIKRRFIVTEALFANTGDLANLPRIIELKNKYKYRLFLDESLSIGVLGDKGRGLVEYYNVPRSEISITIGSMALSFASSGGFCVGVKPMVHHQRIQSLAYVFSASLPPYSAKVSSKVISEIRNSLDSAGKSKLISGLHEKVSYAYAHLKEAIPSEYFLLASVTESPIIHLKLNPEYRAKLKLPKFYGTTTFLTTGKSSKKINQFDMNYNLESFLLQKIIDELLITFKILITRSKLILSQENLPVAPPHILIMINSAVLFEELDKLGRSLSSAMKDVCSNINNRAEFLNLENESLNYKALFP
ncbi:uncharacterized protein PRCAT00002088001 [Priceomyces carsonii]|uniref:uncharacterized protein n=1 Tax=Priceomyces carsonii TaxID=28549 RepID=UPI002ED95894|nr:unnamed protein product [Priceomyces carsonii]